MTSSFNPEWPVSVYELERGKGAASASVYVKHPNLLGVTEGREAEHSRLIRFQKRYISQDMREAALGSKGLRPWFFRKNAGEDLLAACRRKTCFRIDGVQVEALKPDERCSTSREDAVEYNLERSRLAVRYASEMYGPSIAADIELGFTRPIGLDEDILLLPSVSDLLGNGVCDDSTLSVVISYRHTTPKLGGVMNVSQEQWPAILKTLRSVCVRARHQKFRFWTDQILSSRKPSEELRWVSCGILPYTMFPVLYIITDDTRGDLRRMWISIEHLAASLGHGIIHSGPCLSDERLPHEWPISFIDLMEADSDAEAVTWMEGQGQKAHVIVRRLCGAIMCGLVRCKLLSWASDAQDLVDWASAICSSHVFADIGHTFNCQDCRAPLGYTPGNRLMALLSSSTIISPGLSADTIQNVSHPRLDVPAAQIIYDGKTWDGFKEWIPESCLWGHRDDQMIGYARKATDKAEAVYVSDGSVRCIAVLQFTTPCDTTDSQSLYMAHMLVGLTTHARNREIGRVDWTKRFWPIRPLQMWKNFNTLHSRPYDRDALVSMADIVGASSRLDHTDMSNAVEIGTLRVSKVKW